MLRKSKRRKEGRGKEAGADALTFGATLPSASLLLVRAAVLRQEIHRYSEEKNETWGHELDLK